MSAIDISSPPPAAPGDEGGGQVLADTGQAPATDGASAQGGDGRGPWPPTVLALCEKYADICRSAVDPLEIASTLEFEGLGDEAARRRYGHPDVFALAQDMYFRVPCDPEEPELLPDPWEGHKYRPALHALLYGLPAVCFPAAAALMAGPGVLATLIVALLTSWSLAQSLAYFGYTRLGSGREHAQRVLRIGLAVMLVVVLIVMATIGRIAHAPLGILAFGAGECAYMLGACVLMVLGDELLMLAALAPGVLGSALFLALGKPVGMEHFAWAALAATPLLALAFAVARTRIGTSSPGARLVGPADLHGALPTAGFGLVAAGLLSFPIAAGLHGHGGTNPGALLCTVPLSLSMGVAEWNLLAYRRRARLLLRTSNELRAFAMRARLALFSASVTYVVAAAALVVLAAVIVKATGALPLTWAVVPQVVAYLTLGSAMFIALTIQAFGLRAFALASCAMTLAFEIAMRDLGVLTQLVACGELLVALGVYAALALGRAVLHA